MKRLHGWLGPGGTLVLTLPDVSSIYPMLLMRRHWFFYWPDEHLFYFNPKTIQRLLEEEGFEMKRVTRIVAPNRATTRTTLISRLRRMVTGWAISPG